MSDKPTPETPRQEIEFDFGGKTWRVRPVVSIIGAIEVATATPALILARKVYGVEGEVSVTEMVIIMHQLLLPQKGPSQAECGEILMNEGYSRLRLPVGDFLARALKGHAEHERIALEEAKRAAAAKLQEAGGAEKTAGPQTGG